MLNTGLIDSVLRSADEIPPAAMRFREYTKEVFTWKPQGQWSAAECFDHLLRINSGYIPAFENIRRTYREAGEKEFRNSLMGRFIIKSVHPDAPRKVKTLPAFYPIHSDADSSITEEYLSRHNEIRKYISEFRNYDLEKIKVKSPMSSIVRYNLGDACTIIIYHDLRHIKQAQRAVQNYFSKLNKIG